MHQFKDMNRYLTHVEGTSISLGWPHRRVMEPCTPGILVAGTRLFSYLPEGQRKW